MKSYKIKPIIQKRSFLLFELLISLSLILICLLPLIRPRALARQSEVRLLEQIQMEAIAHNAFCYFKEQLYNHTIAWDALADSAQGTLEKTFSIQINPQQTQSFSCNYKTTLLDRVNKPSQKKIGLLVKVQLNFERLGKQTAYERTLYMEQHQICYTQNSGRVGF